MLCFRLLHCINRIADQIYDDLLNLNPVDYGRPDFSAKLRFHGDTRFVSADNGDGACLLDNLVDFMDRFRAPPLPDEFPHLPNDLAGAANFTDGFVKKRDRTIKLRRRFSLSQRQAHRFDKARRSGQRLIELMSDRCRHLAHGADARCMAELELGVCEPALRRALFSDILDEADKDALIVAKLGDVKNRRKLLPVCAQSSHRPRYSDFVRFVRFNIATHVRIMPQLLRRRHKHLDGFADDFRLAISEGLFSLPAETQNRARDIDGHDRCRRGVDYGAEKRPAFGERPFA